MHNLKLILILLLNLFNSSFSQNQRDKKMDDKSSVQILNGKKEKLNNGLISKGFYDPHAVFNYPEHGWKIFATLKSNTAGESEKGFISFHQWGPKNIIRVNVNVNGLPFGKHAVHIHAFGDINRGCNSTGSYLQNNFIGNIDVKENNTTETFFLAPVLKLFGFNGIVGRSVVIHEKPIKYNSHSEIFSTSNFFYPMNAMTLKENQENQLGSIIACGSVLIKSNQL